MQKIFKIILGVGAFAAAGAFSQSLAAKEIQELRDIAKCRAAYIVLKEKLQKRDALPLKHKLENMEFLVGLAEKKVPNIVLKSDLKTKTIAKFYTGKIEFYTREYRGKWGDIDEAFFMKQHRKCSKFL